jgi:hypothetical protein
VFATPSLLHNLSLTRKHLFMKKILLVLAIGSFAVACKKDKTDDNIFKGSVVQVHDGKAWTWLQISKQGTPERIGVTITDEALNSVPEGGDGGHSHENSVVLDFHPKASITPFKHVGLDWNPAGHPPANIYTKPHFDIHFYTVDNAARQGFVDPVKLAADPAAGYLPANHIGADPVPQMGKHWVDITSPELNPQNPQPFTQTFIFGSYDSKVIFYEPMITKEFLKNTSNFERNIPQPAKFAQSGYYPTKMRVVKHDRVTEIILDGLVYRQGS